MNRKMKLFAGMIVFGSLWGFFECIIGPQLSNAGLPDGMIMTGIFTIIFLVSSRMIYQKRGMQIGMGLIAGTLRMFNPLGGCHLCSAIAIMVEGLLFELIWNSTTNLNLDNIQKLTSKISLGILTGYVMYSGGYIVTQLLTPLVSMGFIQIDNVIMFLPQILARALPVALLSAITVPVIIESKKLHFEIKDTLYYPATLSVSFICWIIIIGNWFLYVS
jgi:hypothetical protein